MSDPERFELNPGRSEVRSFPDATEVTFVPMEAVDDITGTIAKPSVRRLGDVRRGYTYFAEGDVLFAKITPCMENGKCAVARDLKNGIGFGSTEFHVVRARKGVLPEWIHLFLRNKTFRDEAKGNMQGGAGQQRVPTEFIANSQVPLPPPSEQRRIVARIGEFTQRLDEIRRFYTTQDEELDAMVAASYAASTAACDTKELSRVARLVRRPVDKKPSESYEEMGIRSFGKGTFQKPRLTGRELGSKRVYWIHAGDLVFNNVFAWEGAIAVAQNEDQGRVGSHRFITYVPFEGEATSEFLCYHFLSARGLEDIRAASPGSAGRNRTLGLTKLAEIKVPSPGFELQERFRELARRRLTIRRLRNELNEEWKAFLPALLAKAFRGEL